MIDLEKLESRAVAEIDEIWRKYLQNQYSVPSRENAIIEAVARNGEGRLIGYGQLKMFGEAILIMDPSASRRDRMQTVRALTLEAFRGADKWNLKDVYAFVKDPALAEIMIKHFGFEDYPHPGQLIKRSL